MNRRGDMDNRSVVNRNHLLGRKSLGLSFVALLVVLSQLGFSPSAGPSVDSLSILEKNKPTSNMQRQKTQKQKECSFLEQFCSNPGQLSVQMAAIPHTASSSTDRVFEAGQKAWNVSAGIHKRGFSCQGTGTIQFSPYCLKSEVQECVLSKLWHRRKAHKTLNQLSRDSDIIFTILREPEQFILSQYKERDFWDAKWKQEYPDDPSVSSVGPSEWAAKDWWRHNLFTKMLATDTTVIWLHQDTNPGTPSKEESDKENSLGENSAWLRVALQRLQDMPFFGLMHRLTESFELMGFHLCFPVTEGQKHDRKPRRVDPILKEVVRKHFALDTILVLEAEKLFDRLVQDMRRKKEQGMLCDLGNVLKAPELEIGFKCVK